MINKIDHNNSVVCRKDLMIKSLSSEIAAEKPDMLSKWVRLIKSLKGSYTKITYSELLNLCNEFLDAFLENLEKGSFLRLRLFLDKISWIRSDQGFRLSEVQRAYYLFYEVITPVLQYLKLKGEITDDMMKEIDDILLEMLFELSESYHKRLNEKMDGYIKEVESINLKLKELSIKDELTGCYNFRYFRQMLDSEIARSTRYNRALSLIIFDIDYFKKVNDEFGHIIGNEVLRFIADILVRSVRTTDLVFRYGGEEFSIILPETSRENAFISAERIRKEIFNKPLNIGSKIINTSISGGISGLCGKGNDICDLISNADKALYLAKQDGRNMVIVDDV